MNPMVNTHLEYINMLLEEKRDAGANARRAREARQHRKRPRRLARKRSRLKPAVV